MPDRLLLRLQSDGDSTWLRQAADGRAMAASVRGMPPASALAACGEIIVLVPAEDVLLTEARVAARNRAQLVKAAPFAIEDQLLAGVEDMQFAVSAGSGDAVGVAAVAKGTLRRWLDRLAAAGIEADAIVPESLALPLMAGRATALLEDGKAVVQMGPWSAFACAPAELPSWLAQTRSALEAIDLYDFREADTSRVTIAGAALHDRQRDALAFMARSLGATPLNLLHGEFASQHRSARGTRRWKVAAMLAAAVVVLAVGNLAFEVLQLSRTSARIDTLQQSAVRKAFPEIDAAELARMAPADLVRDRIARLRGGAQSGDFLRMLAQIAPVIGGMTRVQTRGMEFRNGSLEIGLRAPDVAALDGVRERLAAQPGLKVAVTAANPGEGGIDGRIRVGSGGGSP